MYMENQEQITTQQIPQEIQPAVPPTPHTSKAIIFILLIIIFSAISVYVGIQVGKNSAENQIQTTQKPIVITTPSTINPSKQTTGWKTYTNTALGYELRYPPTVEIDKEFNDKNNRLTTFKGSDINIQVKLNDNSYNVSLDKYYFMDSPIARTTTLAGLSANVYEMPEGYCDGPTCGDPYIAIGTLKGSDFYSISFYGDIVLSDIENQILSTFRFISVSDDSVKAIESFKQGCLRISDNEKMWIQKYNECEEATGDTANISELKKLCDIYNGNFTESANSCRHVPSGQPCGPQPVAVCSL
jgi:hypothetical protein